MLEMALGYTPCRNLHPHYLMSAEKQRHAPKKIRGVALAVVRVLLGFPLILAARIALLFAAERVQIRNR